MNNIKVSILMVVVGTTGLLKTKGSHKQTVDVSLKLRKSLRLHLYSVLCKMLL